MDLINKMEIIIRSKNVDLINEMKGNIEKENVKSGR